MNNKLRKLLVQFVLTVAFVFPMAPLVKQSSQGFKDTYVSIMFANSLACLIYGIGIGFDVFPKDD